MARPRKLDSFKRLSLRLAADLMSSARRSAEDETISLNDFVLRAIEHALDKGGKKKR